MRILFSTYARLNYRGGHSELGALIRCLHIALDLRGRGHEVWLSCAGFRQSGNELIHAVKAIVPCVDLEPAHCDASFGEERAHCREVLAGLKLDMVILGEIPLNGALLNSAVCAVSLGIRVVVLDNAHNPAAAESLCRRAGFADAVVLVGLPACHPANPSSHYFACPPLIESSPDAGQRALTELGLRSGPLIAVLAYEQGVEELAVAVCDSLGAFKFQAIFLSLDVWRSSHALAPLPPFVRYKIRVLNPPKYNTFFGLLRAARLVIGKCGFMQIGESLMLGVPFVGLYYPGCFQPALLPAELRAFVHVTDAPISDPTTMRAIRGFLELHPSDLKGLSPTDDSARFQLGAFLEQLPLSPRPGCIDEAARAGYTKEVIFHSLQSLLGRRSLQLLYVRWSRLRRAPWGTIDQLVCAYREHSDTKFVFLWGVSVAIQDAAMRALAKAEQRRRCSRVLYRSPDGSLYIEEDTGPSRLLPKAAWQG